ncbi:hypothetical protein BH24ACT6_BH24ACT6_03090 [soil metagenome]
MGGFVRVLLTGLAIVSATIVGAPFAEDDRAHACSCVSTSLDEAMDRADLVFVGRLTATDADELMEGGAISDESGTFQFAVSGYYKTLGDVPTEAVEVRSALVSASCGIGVPLAQEWVIFSRRRGDDTFWSRDVAPDELVSTFCDGNRPFGPEAERRLGEPSIEPVAAPPSTSSPDSTPQPSPAASSATSGEEDDDNTVVPIGLVAATAAAVTAVVVLRRARSRDEPA